MWREGSILLLPSHITGGSIRTVEELIENPLAVIRFTAGTERNRASTPRTGTDIARVRRVIIQHVRATVDRDSLVDGWLTAAMIDSNGQR